MAEGELNDYPTPQIPTVFADAVLNLSTTDALAKFYLARNDPSFSGEAPGKVQVFAQVVMPLSGFLQAFAFLEKTIDNMGKNNALIPQLLESARKAVGK